MSNEIKIGQFDESIQEGFLDFAKRVHPQEINLDERMKWFSLGNRGPLSNSYPTGLVTSTTEEEVIGQFLMRPFGFHLRQKEFTGYFGFDFFVKEEYRWRGAGALLFMQGVRMYVPFVGVGLTAIVEKISKAAGVQTIGIWKKFIWVKSPVALGGQLLNRWTKNSADSKKEKSQIEISFPETVEASGRKFQRCSIPPEDFGPSCSEETLEPARSSEFMKWRFFDSPRQYGVYVSREHGLSLLLVVRGVSFQGMRLLLLVDHRFPMGKTESLDIILQAAKSLSSAAGLDGVVTASTYLPHEEPFKREHFIATGKPSSVIAYLPSVDFSPAVTSIHLTVADSDLDFSFGDDR